MLLTRTIPPLLILPVQRSSQMESQLLTDSFCEETLRQVCKELKGTDFSRQEQYLCVYAEASILAWDALTCTSFLVFTEISERCYHRWGVFYTSPSPRSHSEAPAQPYPSQCEYLSLGMWKITGLTLRSSVFL